jgi:hypothetical protein
MAKLSIIILLCFCTICSLGTNIDDNFIVSSFELFQVTYNKHYKSDEEYSIAYTNFKENIINTRNNNKKIIWYSNLDIDSNLICKDDALLPSLPLDSKLSEITDTKLDLERINYIRESSLEELLNYDHVLRMIHLLGLNNEIPAESPKYFERYEGGLYIWQYPHQFAPFLLYISKFPINAILEIGVRFGGTFVLLNEYFRMLRHHRSNSLSSTDDNNFLSDNQQCMNNNDDRNIYCNQNKYMKSYAVDMLYSPVAEYCEQSNNYDSNCQFIKLNSQDPVFLNFVKSCYFDMVFIDGSHSYSGVLSDFLAVRHNTNILVFHDIDNDHCVGVRQFWIDLNRLYADEYVFATFNNQYTEVKENTGKKHLGIGVAVSKRYAAQYP